MKKKILILETTKINNLLTKTKAMKKTLLLLLLFSSIICFASEVTGNVFLDNTSNYSGVTIKFEPVSPSAVYEEGTSNTDGLYTISVTNGTYNVSFEKNGYQTFTLNNQFISTNVALVDVTLSSSGVFNVSGNVSGNWNKSNTYIVTGNITVPSGQSLTIEAGTEIRFDGYYSLIVNGTLNAVGNEKDYIKFTSNNSSPSNKDWNQIQINTSSTSSKLKYCTIEYGKLDNNENEGIVNILGELDLENCIIRNSEEAAISVRGNLVNINILNNQISNCSYGISVTSGGSAVIDNNKFSNINLIGMSIGLNSNTTVVSNNQISNCGIYGIQSWSDIIINNNLVFDNGGYGIMIVGGQPTIRNNTIFSNGSGIGIYSSDFFNPNPIINSNIITNNLNFGVRSEGEPMPNLVTYNLFYNNGSGVGNNLPVGVATVVTTNSNQTDSDTYYNIFSDPNFISTDLNDINFCRLNTNSDAINAGDPSITNSSNASTIDIGAKEAVSVLSTNKLIKNNFTIYPNPSSGVFYLSTKNIINNYKIVNQIGKTVLNDKPSNNNFEIDIQKYPSGIYFIQLQFENGEIETRKIMKK